MWNPGQHRTPTKQFDLKQFDNLKGELLDEEAQISFAKFCFAQPGFAAQLLMGFEPFPIQELIIRMMFSKDYFLGVLSRGSGKTTFAAVFLALYSIFYPGSKAVIVSISSRQTKEIFSRIEKMILSKEGQFLRECLNGTTDSAIKHASEGWRMYFGEKGSPSEIIAVPLGAGGDKIRGLRANLLLADEALLMTENVMQSVILPFASVLPDPSPQAKRFYEAERLLIERGEMKPEDATPRPRNKIIMLSSAGYKYQYLYKVYNDYLKAIGDPDATNVSHVVFKTSYEAIKGDEYFDMSQIENSKKTFSRSQFNREYESRFEDDGDSYYSPRALAKISLQAGQSPTVRVMGDPTKKYVLACDPNYDLNDTCDDFSFCLLELDEEIQGGTMIHGYAMPNGSTKKRARYLKYLLENFNIVYFILDKAGGNKFLSDAKEFEMIPGHIQDFEPDFSDPESFSKTRQNFVAGSKMVHLQAFGEGNWLRDSNADLQTSIEKARMQFGAPIFSEVDFQKNIKFAKQICIEELEYCGSHEGTEFFDEKDKMEDFINWQTHIVEKTKDQCSLIEPKSSPNGKQSFDLPASIRSDKSPGRKRKDSYTTLLLANWGMRCYYNIVEEGLDEEVSLILPHFADQGPSISVSYHR